MEGYEKVKQGNDKSGQRKTLWPDWRKRVSQENILDKHFRMRLYGRKYG